MAESRGGWVIQVTEGWVKLCQLLPRGSQLALGKTACERLGQVEAIQNWIQAQLKDLKVKPTSVLAVLPRHQVILRNLNIPSCDLQEIAQMVALQLPGLVPYSAQDAVWSFQVLKSDPVGGSEVLVAMAPHSVLKQLRQILEPAGLSLEEVNLSSLVMIPWLEAISKGKPDTEEGVTVLVDLDSSSVEIDLIEKGTLLFSRAAPFSDEKIPGGLVEEIDRTLTAAVREIGDRPTRRVILTGVPKLMAPVAQQLRSKFDAPVETVESFKPLTQGPVPEAVGLASFSALFGMGMKPAGTMSLLPMEIRAERTRAAQRRRWTFTCLLLVGAILTGIAAVGWPLLGKRMELAALQNWMAQMEPEVSKLEMMRQQLIAVRQSRQLQAGALELLKELHAIVPGQTALNLLTLEGNGELVLKGQADSMAHVLRLVTTLEGSALFQNVQIRYANKRRFQGREIADFEIQCRLGELPGGAS